jgi:hypothetical protein
MQDMDIVKLDPRFKFVRKFGYNPEIDGGGGAAAADIWDYGFATSPGVKDYPWPAAAATTTIVSDDDEDGGTAVGALTVRVEGLDANWMEATEDVIMDGTQPVTLRTQYIRVHRAFVLTAGSDPSQTNLGNIDIKHGATVLARITAGRGQTLMAIYTIPADFTGAYPLGYAATVHRATSAAAAEISLMIRPFGGAWRTQIVFGLVSLGTSALQREVFMPPLIIQPKTDIRMRCEFSSANDLPVSAEFELALLRGNLTATA